MSQPAAPMVENTFPDVQALLATTLALMTAWAAPCAHAPVAGQAAQRRLLARKIGSNLFLLQQHPGCGETLLQTVLCLQQHWAAVSAGASHAPPASAQPGLDAGWRH